MLSPQQKPKPQPTFNVADFMAQVNKPLNTQPDESSPNTGTNSPTKTSDVQSIKAQFEVIKDSGSMQSIKFEKVAKEDLKGNLSKMMAFLPPPPPPPI